MELIQSWLNILAPNRTEAVQWCLRNLSTNMRVSCRGPKRQIDLACLFQSEQSKLSLRKKAMKTNEIVIKTITANDQD